MFWHIAAKHLKAEEVPVLEILAEFCELAGAFGRNAHKPTMPPSYDFRVKVEVES